MVQAVEFLFDYNLKDPLVSSRNSVRLGAEYKNAGCTIGKMMILLHFLSIAEQVFQQDVNEGRQYCSGKGREENQGNGEGKKIKNDVKNYVNAAAVFLFHYLSHFL